MNTTYALSFALALSTFLMQVVAGVCFGVAVSRAAQVREPATRSQQPAWFLFALSLVAGALSIW